MSTRSGKRIHCSISENVECVSEIQTVRKTRSKRDKQNSDEVPTAKKKKNFVRRPSDDEIESPNEIVEDISKSVRKSRRHTLKELNKPDVIETSSDKKSMRQSRRIRKEDIVEPTNVPLQENNVAGKGKKKNKKKKRAVTENLENEPVENSRIIKKKSNKKRKSNSFIVEELVTGENNKSNVSIDSFHSAAGSPENDNLKNKSLIDVKSGKTLMVKDIKKKMKKTEDDNYLVSSIDKSIELNAKNESFEMRCNKAEKNEDRYENTVSKKKRSTGNKFVNNIENSNSIELNHMETNIQITDLKRKSVEKTNEIKISTLDFTDVPPVNGTLSGSESISASNNSNKKRKSILKNSEKIDTSTTLISEGTEEKSDNLISDTKMETDEITLNNTTSSLRSKNKDATYEKINLSDTNMNQTFDKINNSLDENIHPNKEHTPNNRRGSKRSSIKNTTYDKIEENLNMDTFNKEPEVNSMTKKTRRSSRISLPQDEISTVLNGTYDKISKDVSTSFNNNTYDKLKLDTTSEKTKDSVDGDNTINMNSKSSIISSDNTENMTSDMSEDCSRISITSDDSRTENIVNTTPLLVESSIDESQINSTSILLNTTATPQGGVSENKTSLKREETFTDSKTTPLKRDGTYTDLRKTPSKQRESFTEEPVPSIENPTTPLKREGTFTKETPDVTSLKPTVDKTPTRRQSMPSPGRTPFPSTSGSKGRVKLNVTHSIEKPQRRSSVAVPPRLTKVMFCSPVDNPVAVTQMKGKVIKSNLKGSNKSFMFDETASEASSVSRKRSRTQGGAEDGAKRARLALRQRTTSAAARLQIPAEATPPAKPDAKTRTKLPDFAALHQKQFSKMESLDECQRRRAKRARALLTPSRAPLAHHNETLDTVQPKPTEPQTTKPQATEPPAIKPQATKPASPKSKEVDKKNQSYTRFGFKLNMDVNPFSVTKNTEATKNVIQPKALKRQATLPSLAGATLRKDVAKQTVMREKSFTDRRDQKRTQNRTVIKGVRTNRRFELQMKMRNID